jgi:hypothetical protein
VKAVSECWLVGLLAACSSLPVLFFFTKVQATQDTAPYTQEQAFKRFLRTLDSDKSTRYVAVFPHLDD